MEAMPWAFEAISRGDVVTVMLFAPLFPLRWEAMRACGGDTCERDRPLRRPIPTGTTGGV